MSRVIAYKDIEKRYSGHLSRLDRAYTNDSEIKEQVDVNQQRFLMQQLNHSRDAKHRYQESQQKIMRENQKLLSAIMKISTTDNQILSEMNSRLDSSLDNNNNNNQTSKKRFIKPQSQSQQSQQRSLSIQSENLSLASRMLNLPSLYPKKQFEQDFKQHKRRLSQITRYQPEPTFVTYSQYNNQKENVMATLPSRCSTVVFPTSAQSLQQQQYQQQQYEHFQTSPSSQMLRRSISHFESHSQRNLHNESASRFHQYNTHDPLLNSLPKITETYEVKLRFIDLNLKIKPRTDDWNDQFYFVLKTPKPSRTPFFSFETLYDLEFSIRFKVKRTIKDPSQSIIISEFADSNIRRIQCSLMQNKGNRLFNLGRMFFDIDYSILKFDQSIEAMIFHKQDDANVLGFSKIILQVSQITSSTKIQETKDPIVDYANILGEIQINNNQIKATTSNTNYANNAIKPEKQSIMLTSNIASASAAITPDPYRSKSQIYNPILEAVEEDMPKRRTNTSEKNMRRGLIEPSRSALKQVEPDYERISQLPPKIDLRNKASLQSCDKIQNKRTRTLTPLSSLKSQQMQQVQQQFMNQMKKSEGRNASALNEYDDTVEIKQSTKKTTIPSVSEIESCNISIKSRVQENRENTKIRELQKKLADFKADLKMSNLDLIERNINPSSSQPASQLTSPAAFKPANTQSNSFGGLNLLPQSSEFEVSFR